MNEVAQYFAVIGNPIAHSKSPEIHAQFAAQLGIALRYERVLAPVDGFADTLDALRAQGLRGCNVTVPFKLDAFAYAHERSADVRWAGADGSARAGRMPGPRGHHAGRGMTRQVGRED